MAIREIPRSFEYTCDGCRTVHVQENASGHYTNSRPSHWAHLKIEQDAHDFQGQAVADASITRLLCPVCSAKVFAAVNAALPR
jgi:hypothetical protein